MNKTNNKKKESRICTYCGGDGKILHLGGIEHGTYDTCPRCFGTGKK